MKKGVGDGKVELRRTRLFGTQVDEKDKSMISFCWPSNKDIKKYDFTIHPQIQQIKYMAKDDVCLDGIGITLTNSRESVIY